MKKVKKSSLVLAIVFLWLIMPKTMVKANSLPQRICLDDPSTSVLITSDVTVRGWALNETDIQSVKIYLDDVLKGDATIGQSRPDVNNVFPGYPSGNNSGFTHTIPKNTISEGSHVIKIEAIAKDGSKQYIDRKIQATKAIARMNIDEPSESSFTTDITVRGWALDGSGVKEVKVYVDNVLNGNATISQSRPDVNAALPGYPGGENSGYIKRIAISTLTGGTHSIKVQAIGTDGNEQEMSRSIKVVKLQAKGNIDEPTGGTETKDIKVRGWALNQSGVKEVKVYVDGVLKGNAQIGLSRPDIPFAFPQYANGDKSGYLYTINSTGLESGNKQISVEVIGNDNSKQAYTKTINFEKLPNVSNLDEPGTLINDNKNFNIRGWAIHAYGIKEFKVYLNDELKGNASRQSRPDIEAAFPSYKDAGNSGFIFPIDINSMAPGIYTVKVVAISNGDEQIVLTRKIEIKKQSPIAILDEPSNMKVITTNEFVVRGWSINDSGIKNVQVLLNGQVLGNANIGQSRPDVKAAFPTYTNSGASGYSYTVSTLQMKPGKYNLTVQAIGNDGTKTVNTIDFIFKGLYNYVQYNNTLDYYANVQMNKSAPIVYASQSSSRIANTDEVKYYMNSSNFADDAYGKYMFMKLTYSDGITATNLNKVLDGKGILQGKGEVFLQAGKTYNVNPIYLVAHALLETGNGTSYLSSGKSEVSAFYNRVPILNEKQEVVGYQAVFDKAVEPKVIYNMYGIGAYDDNANLWGSQRAYSEGWFSVDSAIIGGAQWIAKSYIASSTWHQDTLYKMRWNITDNDEDVWHQYASDIGWAYKQINRIKLLVDMMDNPVIYYEVPLFKN